MCFLHKCGVEIYLKKSCSSASLADNRVNGFASSRWLSKSNAFSNSRVEVSSSRRVMKTGFPSSSVSVFQEFALKSALSLCYRLLVSNLKDLTESRSCDSSGILRN